MSAQDAVPAALDAGDVWLILNGKQANDNAVRLAVAAMRERGQRLAVRVTWEAGDATRFVDEAVVAGARTVIAGGGDGSLREVAAALAQRDASADALPSLAVLSLGTANDFGTAAGIPADAEAALALACTSVAQPVDLLRIDADGRQQWCINLASGGFGTTVTTETGEGLKKALGGLAYVVSGLARIGSIEPVTARFEAVDFAWAGDFIALGIGNGRQAGGGQVLCPEALIDDGLLDVTLVPTMEGEIAATVGTLIAEGKQAALERVSTQLQSPWLRIAADPPLTLNLDGEPVAARAFHIECIPGRLRMHLPADCTLLAAHPGPG